MDGIDFWNIAHKSHFKSHILTGSRLSRVKPQDTPSMTIIYWIFDSLVDVNKKIEEFIFENYFVRT